MPEPSPPNRTDLVVVAEWAAIAVLVGGGFFCVWASATDWGVFFADRRARPWVELLGHGGARVFYAAFGAGFVGAGAWMGWSRWRRGDSG